MTGVPATDDQERPRWLVTDSRRTAGWLSVAWSTLLVLQVALQLSDGPDLDRTAVLVLPPLLMAPPALATWLHLRRRGRSTGPDVRG